MESPNESLDPQRTLESWTYYSSHRVLVKEFAVNLLTILIIYVGSTLMTSIRVKRVAQSLGV